jgi:aspartate kinase
VENSVKAVTSIDRVGLVSISGTGMAGVPGVAARVFDSIARGEANVMMISQSSSETNITIVVPRRDLKTCKTQLDAEFEGDDIVNDIIFDEEVAIISVVGSGMRGTSGVASRVFKAVADSRINVMMIAQGSSEVNISFVVGRDDALRAVTSIHREFRLDELFGQKPG